MLQGRTLDSTSARSMIGRGEERDERLARRGHRRAKQGHHNVSLRQEGEIQFSVADTTKYDDARHGFSTLYSISNNEAQRILYLFNKADEGLDDADEGLLDLVIEAVPYEREELEIAIGFMFHRGLDPREGLSLYMQQFAQPDQATMPPLQLGPYQSLRLESPSP